MWFKCNVVFAILFYVSIINTENANEQFKEGKNALDKYTVSNNIKIVYNEVANSFACKVVEGDYYIGDVTHIVKKIENKNYYYDIIGHGFEKNTSEYRLKPVDMKKSYDFTFTYLEMSYNDNGEFYCVLLRSKLKSVPAIVSKRKQQLLHTIESGGNVLPEEVYYHENESSYDVICKYDSYSPLELKLSIDSTQVKKISKTVQLIQMGKRQLPVYSNSIEYVVQLVGDDPSNVLCTAIRGKETISNQNVLLIKASTIDVKCSPENSVAKVGDKITVTCTVNGKDTSSLNYYLQYKILKGPLFKLLRSDGYIKIKKNLKAKKTLDVIYEITVRQADFRNFIFKVNVEDTLISTKFNITKDPKSKNNNKSSDAAKLLSISALTLSLSVLLSSQY